VYTSFNRIKDVVSGADSSFVNEARKGGVLTWLK
jgi:hypothetical protein